MKEKKHHGFTIIDIMLATALLVGIIVLLMKGMHNFARSESTQNNSADYSTLTNDILAKFTSDMKDCQNTGNCPITGATNLSADQYLGITDAAILSKLKEQGIDPKQVTVEISINQ